MEPLWKMVGLWNCGTSYDDLSYHKSLHLMGWISRKGLRQVPHETNIFHAVRIPSYRRKVRTFFMKRGIYEKEPMGNCLR